MPVPDVTVLRATRTGPTVEVLFSDSTAMIIGADQEITARNARERTILFAELAARATGSSNWGAVADNPQTLAFMNQAITQVAMLLPIPAQPADPPVPEPTAPSPPQPEGIVHA